MKANKTVAIELGSTGHLAVTIPGRRNVSCQWSLTWQEGNSPKAQSCDSITASLLFRRHRMTKIVQVATDEHNCTTELHSGTCFDL